MPAYRLFGVISLGAGDPGTSSFVATVPVWQLKQRSCHTSGTFALLCQTIGRLLRRAQLPEAYTIGLA